MKGTSGPIAGRWSGRSPVAPISFAPPRAIERLAASGQQPAIGPVAF